MSREFFSFGRFRVPPHPYIVTRWGRCVKDFLMDLGAKRLVPRKAHRVTKRQHDSHAPRSPTRVRRRQKRSFITSSMKALVQLRRSSSLVILSLLL